MYASKAEYKPSATEKKIALFSGSDNVEVPIIEKKTAQVLSIHGDLANVMEMTTFETMDLKIPEELKNSDDFTRIREESKRKGRVVREAFIDGEKIKSEREFEA